MSKFSEELEKLLAEKSGATIASVRKLSEEDQRALAIFAGRIVAIWLEDGPLTDNELAALWVSAFAFGHNWVKEHWVLW